MEMEDASPTFLSRAKEALGLAGPLLRPWAARLIGVDLSARMLAEAGVPVEVRIWPGQMHVFQLCSPIVGEATRSLRQIGDYIREATW